MTFKSSAIICQVTNKKFKWLQNRIYTEKLFFKDWIECFSHILVKITNDNKIKNVVAVFIEIED